jgi:hypothetical protein
MLKILDPSEACFAYNHNCIFNSSWQEKTSTDVGKPQAGRLKKMFDCLFIGLCDCTQMLEWFHPYIISLVSIAQCLPVAGACGYNTFLTIQNCKQASSWN